MNPRDIERDALPRETLRPYVAGGFPQTIRALLDGLEPEQLDRVAFESDDRGAAGEPSSVVTFRQLRDQVRSISCGLLGLGIGGGDRVGILAENRLEWAISYLAVTSIGATMVSLDVFWTEPEIARVMAMAEPRLVFTTRRFMGKVAGSAEKVETLERIVSFDRPDDPDHDDRPGEVLSFAGLLRKGARGLADDPELLTSTEVHPDDVATIIFLSTNLGVKLTQHNLMADVEGFLGLMGDDAYCRRWLTVLPFHHAWPTAEALLFPLATGCTNVILSSTKLEDLFTALRQANIDNVILVPVLVERIYDSVFGRAKAAGLFVGIALPPDAPPERWFDAALADGRRRALLTRILEEMGLAQLQGFNSGGAHLFAQTTARMKALGIDVLNNYGLTETAPVISSDTPEHHRMGAAGRIYPTMEVRIDQPDRYGNGEIWVRGPQVMDGYLTAPGAEVESPIDGQGWLHTGDIGLVDQDGYLYITGRLKRVIVTTGGKNIYPEELEDAIGRSPYVAEVVVVPKVVGIREFPFAHIRGDLAAVAELERSRGTRLTEAELRGLFQAELQEHTRQVAHYKLPEDFELTFGPLDAEALKAQVLMFDQPASRAEPVAPPEEAAPRHAGVESGSLVRQIVAYLGQSIARTLDSSPDEVDPEESFFAYLSSMEIVEVAATIEREVQVKLYPPMLFEHINIRALAGYFAGEFGESFARALGTSHPSPKTASPDPAAEARPVVKPGATATSRPVQGERAPIAIIGMAGTLPGSQDLAEFWDHLEAGDDLIGEIPEERFVWQDFQGDPLFDPNTMNTRWGGFIEDIDKFDPAFFGISPREARMMDPQQRIFLETVVKALEDAGHRPGGLAGSRVGVFAGVTTYDYMELVRQKTEEVGVFAYTGTFPSVLPNRVSYQLGLHGPSEVVDTACSSALVAIHRARRALLDGECEMALAGGVNALLTPELFISFSKAGMLATDGRCKTFSNRANGYVRGEGVGVVVLKPLDRALADNDQVYAVIRGSAVNHGGRSSSFTSPNPKAQAQLIVSAHHDGDIDPESVSYIEAHGTGTSLGDPIEINGLKSAFQLREAQVGRPGAARGTCGLGSVKTNIGHLESAAGIAGVLKILLAMRKGVLPPSLHCEALSEYIDLEDSPFFVVTERQPWQRSTDEHGQPRPRRAGISSFGVGGTNAHIVLEEVLGPETAEAPTATPTQSPTQQLILLSAKKTDRLREVAKRLHHHLAAMSEEEAQATSTLRDIAYTLQLGRDPMNHRLAFVVSTVAQLKQRLAAFVCDEPDPHGQPQQGTLAKKQGAESATAQTEELDAAVGEALAAEDLEQLATLWTQGAKLDWELLHRHATPQRVSLPTYPFLRKRCWV